MPRELPAAPRHASSGGTTSTRASIFTAPFAATGRLAMRTVVIAAFLAIALFWLTVLALAATTTAAPTTTAAHPDTAIASAPAFELHSLLGWLHPSRSHGSERSPSMRRAALSSSTSSSSSSSSESSEQTALFMRPNASAAEYNETTALYLAHVTSVSYCQAPHVRNWTCQPCALVPALEDVQVVADARGSFQGLVGFSALYDAVVVAFRGSMDLPNWIDNMTFIKTRAYAAYPDVKVHQGFYWVYRSVADAVVPEVQRLLAARPRARVMVTGHSLGAAVAAICAFELTFLYGVAVDALVTFGEPRVGNARFSAMLHNSSVDVFRVTHFRDVVPHLPPTWIGFEHTTREVFYDEFQSNYTLCDAENGEDASCSDACSPFGCTSVVDHLTYLNVTMSHLIC